MSAPDTNVDKQEKKHKPSLWGIRGAMLFGALMIILMLFFVIDNGRDGDVEQGLSNSSEAASESTAAPVDPVATGTNESN